MVLLWVCFGGVGSLFVFCFFTREILNQFLPFPVVDRTCLVLVRHCRKKKMLGEGMRRRVLFGYDHDLQGMACRRVSSSSVSSFAEADALEARRANWSNFTDAANNGPRSPGKMGVNFSSTRSPHPGSESKGRNKILRKWGTVSVP